MQVAVILNVVKNLSFMLQMRNQRKTTEILRKLRMTIDLCVTISLGREAGAKATVICGVGDR